MLFAAVNVARRLNVDPELELRAAAKRFRARVETAEAIAARRWQGLDDASARRAGRLLRRGKGDEPVTTKIADSTGPPGARLARQPDRRSGCSARIRRARPRDRPVGRIDRRARGRRAPRRRPGVGRQGRRAGRRARERRARRCREGARRARPGSTRPHADRARRHPEQGPPRRERDPRRLARRRRRRRPARRQPLWSLPRRGRRVDAARADDERDQRRRARGELDRPAGVHGRPCRRAIVRRGRSGSAPRSITR